MSARSFRRNRNRAAAAAERRRARRAAIATGAAIGAGVVLASPASAANFTVDTLDDPGNGDGCAATDCSLREAITDADANAEPDTITFATGLTGEITLASPLQVTSTEGIDIDGPGVDVVSISGDTNTNDSPDSADVYLLRLNQDADVSIADLTLTEGYFYAPPVPTPPPKYAAGITVDPGASLEVTDSVLSGNNGSFGGAITNYGGTLTVRDTEFEDNFAQFLGGAIFSAGQKYGAPAPSALVATTTVADSEITGGGANLGGGIANAGSKYLSSGAPPNPDGSDLTVTASTISGNGAAAGGGVSSKYATADVADSEIAGNYAAYGGGLMVGSGDVNVGSSTITGNDAGSGDGGGIGVAKYARFELRGSTVSGNTATTSGGIGVNIGGNSGFPFGYTTPPDSSATIVESTIADNDAIASGGGMSVYYVAQDSSLAVRGTTISGNSAGATATGGGIDVYGYVDGDFSLVNSTVSGNDAGYGGGISIGEPYATPPPAQVEAGGAPTIGNSTIAANTAAIAGGGVYLGGYSSDPSTMGSPSASADVPLSSTIVADNTANGSPNDLAAATVDQPGELQLGNSLVETPGTAPVSQNPAGSSILGTDPQLGPLADNGGPTRTHLPANGSPAIDKGLANGLTTDQRGLARTSGSGTDIGSVEVQVSPTPPDTTAPVVTITKKPKKKLKTSKRKRRVRIGFKSSEGGSTFECAIDGGAFEPCTRPFKMKLKAKPGKGAKHTIQIRATDPAGNTGAPVGVKVRVIRKT